MTWILLAYVTIGALLLGGFLLNDYMRVQLEPLRSIWKACVIVLFAWPVSLYLFLVKEDAR
jgi:putative exporter of polyketide antibiotics